MCLREISVKCFLKADLICNVLLMICKEMRWWSWNVLQAQRDPEVPVISWYSKVCRWRSIRLCHQFACLNQADWLSGCLVFYQTRWKSGFRSHNSCTVCRKRSWLQEVASEFDIFSVLFSISRHSSYIMFCFFGIFTNLSAGTFLITYNKTNYMH